MSNIYKYGKWDREEVRKIEELDEFAYIETPIGGTYLVWNEWAEDYEEREYDTNYCILRREDEIKLSPRMIEEMERNGYYVDDSCILSRIDARTKQGLIDELLAWYPSKKYFKDSDVVEIDGVGYGKYEFIGYLGRMNPQMKVEHVAYNYKGAFDNYTNIRCIERKNSMIWMLDAPSYYEWFCEEGNTFITNNPSEFKEIDYRNEIEDLYYEGTFEGFNEELWDDIAKYEKLQRFEVVYNNDVPVKLIIEMLVSDEDELDIVFPETMSVAEWVEVVEIISVEHGFSTEEEVEKVRELCRKYDDERSDEKDKCIEYAFKQFCEFMKNNNLTVGLVFFKLDVGYDMGVYLVPKDIDGIREYMYPTGDQPFSNEYCDFGELRSVADLDSGEWFGAEYYIAKNIRLMSMKPL